MATQKKKKTRKKTQLEKEMTFLEHLEELRWHIIRSLGAITVIAVGLFVYHEWLFENVIKGPLKENFITFRLMCDFSQSLGLGKSMCVTPPDLKLQAIGWAETFFITLKFCFVSGLILAFPYVFYEFWKFIKPGLYAKEQKAARGVVFVCSLLFTIGALFGYFVIAPFSIKFLAGFTLPGVEIIPQLSSHVSYMIMFTLPCGLVFEFPMVVYFLTKIGLLTSETMRAYRKHSVIGILVLAAVITPSVDVFTQMLVAVPLYILYELSILVALRVEKQEQEEEDRDGEEQENDEENRKYKKSSKTRKFKFLPRPAQKGKNKGKDQYDEKVADDKDDKETE